VNSKDISVTVTVPDMGWKVHIQGVYQVDGELWVVSILTRTPGIAGQIITTVSDTVTVTAPNLPIKHFLLGKTWTWQNKEGHVFIQNIKEIEDRLKAGKQLFRRDRKAE